CPRNTSALPRTNTGTSPRNNPRANRGATMRDQLLYAMGALALLTFTVLLFIPIRRFRAAFAGHIGPEDFKYGESDRVPGSVALPNRNYMNLTELPVLFYAVCLMFYVTNRT